MMIQMNNCLSPSFVIAGSGAQSIEIIKVLNSLSIVPVVLVRNINKVNGDLLKYNIKILDYNEFYKTSSYDSNFYLYVATSIDSIVEVTSGILYKKPLRILLEKPVSLDCGSYDNLVNKIIEADIPTYVAYNRRYFDSFIELKKRLKSEEVVQIDLNISELISRVPEGKYSQEVLRKWIIANGSHLLDLAINIADSTEIIDKSTVKSDKFQWKGGPASFSGIFLFSNGIILNVVGVYNNISRWSMVVNTRDCAYRLEPIETLSFKKTFSDEYKVLRTSKQEGGIRIGNKLMINDFMSSSPSNLPELQHSKAILSIADNFL